MRKVLEVQPDAQAGTKTIYLEAFSKLTNQIETIEGKLEDIMLNDDNRRARQPVRSDFFTF